MKKAVFLDRDGVLCEAIVINRKPYSPNRKDMGDLIIHPSTMLACKQLRAAGFKLLCFTNQPDIARGKVDVSVISTQNTLISKYCSLDATLTCPHDNDDHCACRKPSPGMIYSLAIEHEVDLNESYLIGDRWSDIEAGAAAGIDWEALYYINRGYDEPEPKVSRQDVHFIQDAVKDILGRQ